MRIHRNFSPMRFRFSSTVISVAAALFGLFLFLKPKTTTSLLFIIAGCLFFAFGIYKIIISLTVQKGTSNLDLGVGIGSFVIGAVCIIFKSRLLSFVPYIVGIVLLFSGLSKLLIMMSIRRTSANNRWIAALATACISLVMGIILMANPFAAVMTLIRAVGLILIIESVQDLLIAQTCTSTIETFFHR